MLSCFAGLRLVYPMLSVSLNCPFLVVPSVLFYVYHDNNYSVSFLVKLTISKYKLSTDDGSQGSQPGDTEVSICMILVILQRAMAAIII